MEEKGLMVEDVIKINIFIKKRVKSD